MVEVGEVLKEYEFRVSTLRYTVKGRVTKFVTSTGSEQYQWTISHHYRPSIAAGVYYPSKTTFSTFEDAEASLRGYAGTFVPNIEVVENEYY